MGVQTLSFLRIQHRPRVPPRGGDNGSWDNYFLPSPFCTSVLTQGGTAREKQLLSGGRPYHH